MSLLNRKTSSIKIKLFIKQVELRVIPWKFLDWFLRILLIQKFSNRKKFYLFL